MFPLDVRLSSLSAISNSISMRPYKLENDIFGAAATVDTIQPVITLSQHNNDTNNSPFLSSVIKDTTKYISSHNTYKKSGGYVSSPLSYSNVKSSQQHKSPSSSQKYIQQHRQPLLSQQQHRQPSPQSHKKKMKKKYTQ